VEDPQHEGRLMMVRAEWRHIDESKIIPYRSRFALQRTVFMDQSSCCASSGESSLLSPSLLDHVPASKELHLMKDGMPRSESATKLTNTL